MTASDLAARASALFPSTWKRPVWQKPLAEKLINPATGQPVAERTVRRWKAGAEIPPWVEGQLRELEEEKRAVDALLAKRRANAEKRAAQDLERLA